MDRQIKWFMTVLFFMGGIPANVALSNPVNSFQEIRYKIVNTQMDCIEKQMQQNIGWNDVCDVPHDQSSQAAPKDAVLEHWDNYAGPNNHIATDSDLFREYQYRLASEFSYFSYHEKTADMKERGPFFGIYGAYDWRPAGIQDWWLNVLHLDTHFNFGLVDYKSTDAEVANLKDFMAEPRLWLGRDLSPFDFTRLTPYGGLGYRYLYDHLGQASDIGGYDRTSEYLYVPIGFDIENQSVPGWQFGLNVEYDIFIQGWQENYLSNVSEGNPNFNNKQNSGFGIRGSLDIIKKMEHVNFLFSPYIRYWKIRQSKLTTAINTSSEIEFVGYEPTNSSTEIGARFGVQF